MPSSDEFSDTVEQAGVTERDLKMGMSAAARIGTVVGVLFGAFVWALLSMTELNILIRLGLVGISGLLAEKVFAWLVLGMFE